MLTVLQLMGVTLTALLAENFILVNCLGIGTRTQAFCNPLDAWRTGFSLTVVMTLTAVLGWGLNLLLRHFALSYYQTLVFALLGPAVVGALRYTLKNCVPELSRRMDANLASITSNCAAMGTALLVAQRSYGIGEAFLYGLFGGLGATIALMSFAGLRGEVSLNHCPKCFQGMPIELITAGMMALSLVGFYGLHLV